MGVGSMTRTGWKAPGISRILKTRMLEGWGPASWAAAHDESCNCGCRGSFT